VRKATTAIAVAVTSFRAMRHDDSRDTNQMIMALFISVGAGSRIRCHHVPDSVDPWRQARRSNHGQTILTMFTNIRDDGYDLRLWVELRGFEPLTPSMRIRYRRLLGF
jgi:hypothetical protein